MKFLTGEGIKYKIVIALVIVILFNFVSPRIVFAIDASAVGGILFEPIKDLLLVIADGIVTITQSMLFQTDASFITLEHKSSWVSGVAGWIVRYRCSAWGSCRNYIRSNYRRS